MRNRSPIISPTASQEINYLKQNYNFPIFTQVVETVRALEMSYEYYHRYQKMHDQTETPLFSV